MQVSYGEGVASHTGSESCGSSSNARAEALTGEYVGRVSSREMLLYSRVPTRWVTWKATLASAQSQALTEPYAVVDLSTHRNTLYGNREILWLLLSKGLDGRIGKSKDAPQ